MSRGRNLVPMQCLAEFYSIAIRKRFMPQPQAVSSLNSAEVDRLLP
jgi:hypothetical protein